MKQSKAENEDKLELCSQAVAVRSQFMGLVITPWFACCLRSATVVTPAPGSQIKSSERDGGKRKSPTRVWPSSVLDLVKTFSHWLPLIDCHCHRYSTANLNIPMLPCPCPCRSLFILHLHAGDIAPLFRCSNFRYSFNSFPFYNWYYFSASDRQDAATLYFGTSSWSRPFLPIYFVNSSFRPDQTIIRTTKTGDLGFDGQLGNLSTDTSVTVFKTSPPESKSD